MEGAVRARRPGAAAGACAAHARSSGRAAAPHAQPRPGRWATPGACLSVGTRSPPLRRSTNGRATHGCRPTARRGGCCRLPAGGEVGARGDGQPSTPPCTSRTRRAGTRGRPTGARRGAATRASLDFRASAVAARRDCAAGAAGMAATGKLCASVSRPRPRVGIPPAARKPPLVGRSDSHRAPRAARGWPATGRVRGAPRPPRAGGAAARGPVPPGASCLPVPLPHPPPLLRAVPQQWGRLPAPSPRGRPLDAAPPPPPAAMRRRCPPPPRVARV